MLADFSSAVAPLYQEVTPSFLCLLELSVIVIVANRLFRFPQLDGLPLTRVNALSCSMVQLRGYSQWAYRRSRHTDREYLERAARSMRVVRIIE